MTTSYMVFAVMRNFNRVTVPEGLEDAVIERINRFAESIKKYERITFGDVDLLVCHQETDVTVDGDGPLDAALGVVSIPDSEGLLRQMGFLSFDNRYAPRLEVSLVREEAPPVFGSTEEAEDWLAGRN